MVGRPLWPTTIWYAMVFDDISRLWTISPFDNIYPIYVDISYKLCMTMENEILMRNKEFVVKN